MPNSVKETLVEARKLIEEEKNWVKGAYKREGIFPRSPLFCAVGTLREIDGEYEGLARKALGQALQGNGPTGNGWYSVPRFNDHPNTTHADILALFDRAIAAQGEGQ